ncbi:nitrate- and nitrite sensing domain-containing protein [Streptomyces sp. H10-C2]|uniref:sensor histidine kinase n=1 Tax=unclassified Streptomyces TaxID=2593676 RepID=UPI0024B98571|nr:MULTISPECIES: nitrate- and nitrite sensing domain-containing protein [unclassified Streptomyces]MDJ0346073.1 nitrate- and nitrite sensing domain-containing protein [Streptomyces sp. PH10-H1]MDJ0373049.1 nitrate- and nitrite sensing domain-containing protein [Streptomyces sp. H10-C2]
MRFRGTTIRRKIVALLLIPLVSLTAIWAFAATLTGREVWGLLGIERIVNDVGYPTEDAVQALQQERRAAILYLADTRRSDFRSGLAKQELATDKVFAKLRSNASDSATRGDLSGDARIRLDAVTRGFEDLAALRGKVDNQTITRIDAFGAYNEMVDPCYDLLDSLNPLNNVQIDKQGRALITIARAREAISREDALMAATISAGRMSQAEMRTFTFAVAEQRDYYDDNLKLLPEDERSIFDEFWRGANGKALRTAEDSIISAGAAAAPRAADRASWPSAASTALGDLDRLDTQAGDLHKKRAEPYALRLLIMAAIAGGLGLIAVIASVFVSVRIGRSLIRDLSGLRKEAQEVSGTRLPRVMRRLAAGEKVDVETEVPRLEYSDDEVGQVGKALNTLQRAAVEAAVRQSDMRRGVSDVFVNLARRSQVLLHRQLTLLDAMERRTEDTEELADLFRLDHMTTRMRRHAEGLVILSGAAPSRQWRKPIQLMDVVRAAVAEVEDYERIEVRRLPRLAVAGSAVADVTHLVAELIENAAVFSPPHTAVRVHGEHVANGFVLEIDDRGLGLTPDALLEANLRLAETPEFELSDTDRLGLFVVSRLAQRHGVRVSLRLSPYGGTTAVVLIPATLLTDTGEDTGATRMGTLLEAEESELEPSSRHEHSFRQWGLDVAGSDGHKEHVQVPDAAPDISGPGSGEPGPLPRRRRTAPVLVSDRGRAVAPPTVPAARAAEPPAPSGPAAGSLPKRVRQANLAPQLRVESASQDGGTATRPGKEAPRERSADEVRDRMAALQRGWQRGREHDLEDDEHGPHGPDDASTAPRTTPEGNGR